MKLTVKKTTYGKNERPIIELNYHNGGDRPMFEIVGGEVWIEVFELIQLAKEKGCEINYVGFEKYKQQFDKGNTTIISCKHSDEYSHLVGQEVYIIKSEIIDGDKWFAISYDNKKYMIHECDTDK